jgi:hypothetical protein
VLQLNPRTAKFCFLGAVTVTLVIPVLADLFLSRPNTGQVRAAIPYQFHEWKGKDLPIGADVRKHYDPLDVVLTWRKYRCTDKPSVEVIIQQATNFENLHNLFACMVFAGARPKRVGVVKLSGPQAPTAALFECRLKGKPYYSLFCYQTPAGCAVYPAQEQSVENKMTINRRITSRHV